ncbi:4-hydroxythreonine-4-phosphate dehydrogenase PdxA [uncultured Hyphomonas sp.]|uniref:4-hydroxythreonine-4-phosphate dehydrogenase PdxA n=1 Tax=uncultured Hyphomonas sp. TaxID=225298 RepID=UPI002AABBA12|nr:4-hydroxythreonine-4-phosphate dehydrogenase PdxA [uncultured Hyphomonas sp.]
MPLPPLVLSMGDPAGVGPAITAEAWKALKTDRSLAFYVIGAPELYRDLCKVQVISSPEDAIAVYGSALPVLPVGDLPAIEPGKPNATTAPAIISAIETGVAHVRSGKAAGLVTNPINKALLYGAGFKHPGHTEFVAELCRPEGGAPLRPVMMLTGGGLRVALATIHQSLASVPGSLTQEGLVELGTIVHAALKSDFGIPSPRIALSGLNPHAGEGGALGREEIDIINPAAETLRSRNIDISDARPGDTVFAEALSGTFDAVIAMTHDQGLIPVKTLDFWGGVNMTLGLPIVRTSPDHGTGYDAAAAGTARPDSLIAAIRSAAMVARNRQAK